MKFLVCWRFIQIFKADSELNHYSVLLRNDFFLHTRFYLASPFRRERQRNTQKVFFSLKNIILEFFVPCIASEQERNAG